jgi:hypothetical protein
MEAFVCLMKSLIIASNKNNLNSNLRFVCTCVLYNIRDKESKHAGTRTRAGLETPPSPQATARPDGRIRHGVSQGKQAEGLKSLTEREERSAAPVFPTT